MYVFGAGWRWVHIHTVTLLIPIPLVVCPLGVDYFQPRHPGGLLLCLTGKHETSCQDRVTAEWQALRLGVDVPSLPEGR